MAAIPSDEECARSVLEIFRGANQRPGEALPLQYVQNRFPGGRADDLDRGLRYCRRQGWLSPVDDWGYAITEQGFKES